MKTLLALLVLLLLVAPASAQVRNIYANDGTFLGNTGSQYDANSINNPYGQYGSQYSQKSMNNPYSTYGSQYSQQSPNNQYATPGYSVQQNGTGYTRFGGSPYMRY